ncbi:MAG TPA: enoyl-CoA hydratase/isomerase [Rhizomicrobium sp.]|nr:enoyl-CoA hydratase/isomerase [Rhizomicrobium sp.]
MKKDFERAHLTLHGDVAVLTMNHPEAMNAASAKMVRGMLAALDEIETPQSGIRALIFTGEGRGFCAGANLTEPPEHGAGPISVGYTLDKIYHPFLRRLRDLRMPIVTAVNGAAAGVGMSLALMGDIVIAARSAYFLQAFARIGLVPDGGSTWLLPRLIGVARAKELSLLAEKLPAEKALEWGLINRVCDDAALLDEALAIAGKLAKGPTATLVATRQLYFRSLDNTYEEQLEAEREAQERAAETEDFREGVRGFLQKTPPNFKGR